MTAKNDRRKEAAQELLRRRAARSNLLDFTRYTFPEYKAGWFHRKLASTLDKFLDDCVNGRSPRLMVMAPPRHGKSEQVSRRLPAYAFGRHPDLKIISCSYSSDLSSLMNRDVQRIIDSPEYRMLFPGTALSGENVRTISVNYLRNSDIFEIVGHGGMYRSCGVGGGITGIGGNLLSIDDPVKDAQQAYSETYRQAAWEWYQTTFKTRAEKGAGILLTMCMTGDTPILMSDGTERLLRDIKKGDNVATFDKGRLLIASVLNQKSNGHDFVFKITTTCGKMVHANERHPFLTENHGELKWIRLKNLTMGQKIVIVKDDGENGKGKPVLSRDVRNQLAPGGIAHRITKKQSGPLAIGRRQLMPYLGAILGLKDIMASHLPSMMLCLWHKMVSALFAISHQEKMLERIGEENYALTIATKQIQSEPYCATTAILPLDMPKQPKMQTQLQNISDFTVTTIAKIEPAGIAEVFDVQIDRTENFIANGLVSHNTRWHHDDLAGRILKQSKQDGGRPWDVISFPAIAEHDEEFRKAGEALHEERKPLAELLETKTECGSYVWGSLYQQRPSPESGNIVSLKWFQRYNVRPANIKMIVHSWDTGTKAKEHNNPTAGGVWGITDHGYYLLDVIRRRMEYPELKRTVPSTFEKYRGAAVLIEDKGSGQSLIQDLRQSINMPVIAIEPCGDKLTRMMTESPAIEAGRVFLPETAPWLVDFEGELSSFPNGANDDQVDMVSQFLCWIRKKYVKLDFKGTGQVIGESSLHDY